MRVVFVAFFASPRSNTCHNPIPSCAKSTIRFYFCPQQYSFNPQFSNHKHNKTTTPCRPSTITHPVNNSGVSVQLNYPPPPLLRHACSSTTFMHRFCHTSSSNLISCPTLSDVPPAGRCSCTIFINTACPARRIIPSVRHLSHHLVSSLRRYIH